MSIVSGHESIPPSLGLSWDARGILLAPSASPFARHAASASIARRFRRVPFSR